MNRRTYLEMLSLIGVGIPSIQLSSLSALGGSTQSEFIKHSVSRWCYNKYPLEQLIEQCKSIGIHSIELLNPSDYKTVIKAGLSCAVSNASQLGITKGFNNPIYHKKLQEDYTSLIESAHEFGVPNVVCFSGNREYITDEGGLENCAQGMAPIIELAEKYNVTLVMELLNSKVDHSDYMCDHTSWGVELVKKIDSPNFKLLYDIYHMQIMEGDIIRTIKENIDYIAHFHTGGNPGRNEIDDAQELNYKTIVKAIHSTGYKGFIGQEFMPSRDDDFKSLRDAIEICTIK